MDIKQDFVLVGSAGQVVTLAARGTNGVMNGDVEGHPHHLQFTQIMLTVSAAAVPTEFWGCDNYTVTISKTGNP